MRPRSALLALALTMIAAHATASERTKRECADAATKGQRLRDNKELKAAREAFASCARPACPEVVRESCVPWLEDVESRLPKLIVRAVDATDHEISDAHVVLDGEDVEVGTSVALEPGSHTVEVHVGDRKQSREVQLAEREARTLLVPFGSRSSTAEPQRGATSKIPLGTWVLGGVSAVGVASFAVLGVIARSDLSSLRSSCAPSCSQDQYDRAHREALFADVSLGVGVAAGIGALLFYFIRPNAAVSAQLGLLRGAPVAGVTGSF
jgi:hypothetical protein